MRQISRQKAFTLLELLIVLALITVILGIGLPGMQRMYLRSQLKGAAQELQGLLYRTRLESMKTGKAYVFRYQSESNVFEILPKDVFDQREKDQTGLGAAAIGPELLGPSPAPSPLENPSIYQRTLPNGILFGSPTTTVVTSWSTPILFYPNGRTSQAALIMKTSGTSPLFQKLALRGLTGTAQLTEK